MVSKTITDHINDVVEEFKRKDPKNIKSAKDINTAEGSYFCHDLAHEVAKRFPRAAVVAGGPDHTFLQHEGKYYDAEAPHGVDHPNDLPHYKRSSRKYSPNYFGFH